MSSTIKQAIESLKTRIADAYAAIQTKGGTLPATQDSANLPTAIASIPTGGGGMSSSDVVYINTADSATIASISGADTKDLLNVPNPTLTNLKYINGAGALSDYNLIEHLNVPALLKISTSAGSLQRMTNLKSIYAPLCEEISGNWNIRWNGSLVKAQFPSVKTHSGSAFYNCDNLIDIEIGASMTGNLTIIWWRPTNALSSSLTTLITDPFDEDGDPITNNLEQLLYNIRRHIATQLNPNVTATIAFYANIYNAIQASAKTVAAFPASWTIAST